MTNKLVWVEYDGDCGSHVLPDDHIHLIYKYEDGRTLREKYPDTFRQVPEELANRLTDIRIALRDIEDEIYAYKEPE